MRENIQNKLAYFSQPFLQIRPIRVIGAKKIKSHLAPTGGKKINGQK
jgi:hypothetical protein